MIKFAKVLALFSNPARLIMLIVTLVAAAAAGWISHKFLGNDNALEESLENYIHDETGLNLDLSPGEEK